MRLSWSSLEMNQPWYSSAVARKALKFTPAPVRVTLPVVVSWMAANRKPPRSAPV
jgi:hypothetical protein